MLKDAFYLCLAIQNVLLVYGRSAKDYSTTTWVPVAWSTGVAWTTTTEGISFPPEGCPPGWINSQEGCFLFLFNKHVTWREAQLECESLGGFLAEVKNQEQSTLLVKISI